MDKQSKYFFLVFFIIISAVVAVAFFKYFVWHDYYVKVEAECDPAMEECFIYECDPEEEADCPSDSEERVSYYKYVNKKAYLLTPIEPSSEDFPGFGCQEWEECEEILCSEKTREEWEECNNPLEYNEENAEEDMESELEEEGECIGGEECSLEDEEDTYEIEDDNGDSEDEDSGLDEDEVACSIVEGRVLNRT